MWSGIATHSPEISRARAGRLVSIFQNMIGRGHPTSRTDISDPTQPAFAAVVQAAAALYLGLGGRNLRDVLATGHSLAEVAEWRGQSVQGLERAIMDAHRRTRGRKALPAAAVDQVLNVAEEGWSTWQARVEQVIAARRPRRWRPTAA